MQVLCQSTDGNAETNCCICGQGFVMFWERQSRSERAEAVCEIQRTLRSHHRGKSGHEAHPAGGFLVPELNGAVAASGVAVLDHAPTYAL
jgi:hypothetical protein